MLVKFRRDAKQSQMKERHLFAEVYALIELTLFVACLAVHLFLGYEIVRVYVANWNEERKYDMTRGEKESS